MNHQAVRNLYPNVVTIDDGTGCFDRHGNKIEIDIEQVEMESIRLEELHQSLSYQRQRAPEYPPLQDLADALYWQAQGNNEPMNRYLAACAAVKVKYPKGGTNA
jgi:hypothetical protein